MSEREQPHRHAINTSTVLTERIKLAFSLVTAILMVLDGIVTALAGYPWVGVAIATSGPIDSLIAGWYVRSQAPNAPDD